MYKIKDIFGTILFIFVVFLIGILLFSRERFCQHHWIYFDGSGNRSEDFDPYRCCSKCCKLEIDLSMVSYSITKAADFAYSPSASDVNIRKEIIRKVKEKNY